MKKIMMLGAALLALQAIPAFAEEHGPPPEGKNHGGPGKFFEKQDTNGDGILTEEEYLNFGKQRFAEMDANKDGKVTKEETEALRDQMRKKWEARKAEMMAKKEAEGKAADPAEAPKAE